MGDACGKLCERSPEYTHIYRYAESLRLFLYKFTGIMKVFRKLPGKVQEVKIDLDVNGV
jgi:hypothetical protein